MTNRILALLGMVVSLAAYGACGDDNSDGDAGSDYSDVRDAADEGRTCPTGQEPCGTECVILSSSPDHCGACDNACASNELCVSGSCELDCPLSSEYDDCGGTECAGLLSDPDNCGACGTACGATEVCSCGVCTDACADINTDATNCGGCGLACGSGEQCCCGGCTADATCPDPCQMIPLPDQLECGSDGRACADSRNHMFNCGACDTSCEVTQACGDGVCTTETCTGSEVYCDGRCTNLLSSSENCGRCSNACDPATEYCFNGECVRS